MPFLHSVSVIYIILIILISLIRLASRMVNLFFSAKLKNLIRHLTI